MFKQLYTTINHCNLRFSADIRATVFWSQSKNKEVYPSSVYIIVTDSINPLLLYKCKSAALLKIMALPSTLLTCRENQILDIYSNKTYKAMESLITTSDSFCLLECKQNE